MTALVHLRRRPWTRPSPRSTTDARPVAGGTDLVVGARQGKAPLPDAIVAIDRIAGLGDDRGSRRRRAHPRRPRDPRGDRALRRTIARAVHGARRRLGDRRVARHPRAGHDRRQRDERLAGDGHRRPAPVLRRDRDPALGGGRADRGARRAVDRSGRRRPPSRASCSRRSCSRLRPPGTGSAYVRLEYRRQMEIAVVGATAVVTVDGDAVTDARIAITALTPTIRRVPEAEQALAGAGGSDAVTAAAAAAAAASTPISDVRASAEYRRAMAEVIARRAIEVALARARGGDVPIPASSHGGRSMKVQATLTVNGTAYPVEVDPHLSLLARRPRGGRAHRLEGGLRRLRVRRVHDAPGRQAGELVLVPGAAGRGPPGHHGRGPRRRRAAERARRPRSCSRAGSSAASARRACSSPRRRCCSGNADPSEDEIRIGLSGNLCRCTGYDGIVRAVARRRRGRPVAQPAPRARGARQHTAAPRRLTPLACARHRPRG